MHYLTQYTSDGFFNHVVDTYTNWEEQRPLYNLFSNHRYK